MRFFLGLMRYDMCKAELHEKSIVCIGNITHQRMRAHEQKRRNRQIHPK